MDELFSETDALAAGMGVQVRFKDESLLMRCLGKLLFFNPLFMTRFTTTLGKTVYFPSRKGVQDNPTGAAQILAHELVHVQDQQDRGTLAYLFTYARPQIFAGLSLLSLLALLAIPYPAWWLCSLSSLISLCALAPWPAKGRAELEFRGYAMTMACKHWLGRQSTTRRTGSWTALPAWRTCAWPLTGMKSSGRCGHGCLPSRTASLAA